MARTIAYARVSTDRQDAANQEFELRKYMNANGLRCDEFISEVISGKVDVKDRKMGVIIEQLEAGDTLIVSELSRISRKLMVIMSTLQYCLSNNIKVIAVKENWVLGDDLSSQVLAFAFGIAADIERRLISARTKEALARRKSEGVKLGRPAGSYHSNHYKLHGKDEQIRPLLASGVSISAIARYFAVNRETMRRYVSDHQLRFPKEK
jgi:DNA invertase Pin-like site-specific DNA recombinase